MKKKKDCAAVAVVNVEENNDELNSSSIFPIPSKDSVLICPISGVGQIGMNWTLYGFDGKWLLVDAGVGFAPKDCPDVSVIMPDVHSLEDILPDLIGLIITHAHEDHIGAVHRVGPDLGCPIYATPFASAVIGRRLDEAGVTDDVSMALFMPGDQLDVGPFRVQTVPVTHSVPECVSLAIETEAGVVFHTGDWKLDRDPVIGSAVDVDHLKTIGERGVLAVVGDSTNADQHAPETSEADLARGFETVMRETDGLVIVTCFATNIARLATIVEAAERTGRVAALAGRSLVRNEEIAREVGLLDGRPHYLADARHLRGLDKKEMVLVCTGSQGEERAALARIAKEESCRFLWIGPGDALVHSARPIPGNEDSLDLLFSLLRKKGVAVHEGAIGELPLHVTGHAMAGEIETLYDYLRPVFSIPTHGEPHHLEAHAIIAKRAGVKEVALASEGGIWEVSASGMRQVSQIQMEYTAEIADQTGSALVPWQREIEITALQAEVPLQPTM